jgi:hypothetical protein
LSCFIKHLYFIKGTKVSFTAKEKNDPYSILFFDLWQTTSQTECWFSVADLIETKNIAMTAAMIFMEDINRVILFIQGGSGMCASNISRL